jgi:zinc-ribbon domain
MFCIHCGASNPIEAKFCRACGAQTGESAVTPPTTTPGIGDPDRSNQNNRRYSRSSRAWLIVLAGVAALVVMGILVGKDNNSSSAASSSSTEFKLAVIDANGTDEVRVARYRKLLDLLEDNIGDSPDTDQSVGTAFVAAQNILKKQGISESLLNIMEGMNQVISPGKKDLITENLGVYISFRSECGLPHEQAITLMRRFGPKAVHLIAAGKIRSDDVGGLIIETENGVLHFTAEMLQSGTLSGLIR